MVLIIYYCSGERNRFLYSVRSDADEIVFTIRKGEISKGYFEIWLLYLIYGLHISREKFPFKTYHFYVSFNCWFCVYVRHKNNSCCAIMISNTWQVSVLNSIIKLPNSFLRRFKHFEVCNILYRLTFLGTWIMVSLCSSVSRNFTKEDVQLSPQSSLERAVE